MNYLRHYVALMRKGLRRSLSEDVVCEKHHIFPQSIYGKNTMTVRLTLEEHYIAHKLLWKAFRDRYGMADPRTRKMATAFHKMVYCIGDTHRRPSNNSYRYRSARIAALESKRGVLRPDMKGKAYFGANEEVVRTAIEKMRVKKTGMKIDYPKGRKSSLRSGEIAEKISIARLKTSKKYASMSDTQFGDWLKAQNFFRKDGKRNPNVTRAIAARNEEVDFYYDRLRDYDKGRVATGTSREDQGDIAHQESPVSKEGLPQQSIRRSW